MARPVKRRTRYKDGTREAYFYSLMDGTGVGKEYVPISYPGLPETDIKLIAFFLPQFHPIPENDKWWGKGFTEWTNVTRAIPQFIGHYQPKLPGELGFYDLRIRDVQRRQVELAKQYGLYGFCFHFYWFGGKRLLEMPLEQFVSDPDIDFPFCINWANENWSRRWDGMEEDVLIGQRHSPDDDIAFIKYISKYLHNTKYIRIDSKPLLIVYRPALMPEPKKTADRWRQWCHDNGIGEIYLALTHSFEHLDPREIGFDAALEFAPNSFPLKDIAHRFDIVNDDFKGRIFDYKSAIELARDYIIPSFPKFRGICPAWDNGARRPGAGTTLANSSPSAYKEWLRLLCNFTSKNFAPDERLIFINAWNEWAEGAYLEPDRKFGYAYLQATAEVLQENAAPEGRKMDYPDPFSGMVKRHDTAVILHLYYTDMWEEIFGYLANLDWDFDLFISIPREAAFSEERILRKHKHAYIYRCQNRGRDIAPFLRILAAINSLGYKYALKVHTKRSSHRQDGDIWRQDLYGKLAGSRELVDNIKITFDKLANIGIFAPNGHIVPSTFYWGQNAEKVKKLARLAGIPYKNEIFQFIAGSMFWFRPTAFQSLVDLNLTDMDFEPEQGQVDGTMAHAVERFFGLMIKHEGLDIFEFSDKEGIRLATASYTDDYPFVEQTATH